MRLRLQRTAEAVLIVSGMIGELKIKREKKEKHTIGTIGNKFDFYAEIKNETNETVLLGEGSKIKCCRGIRKTLYFKQNIRTKHKSRIKWQQTVGFIRRFFKIVYKQNIQRRKQRNIGFYCFLRTENGNSNKIMPNSNEGETKDQKHTIRHHQVL